MRVYGSDGVHRRFDAQQAEWNDQYIEGWLEYIEVNPFETIRIDENTTITALPAVHARPGEGAQTYLFERGSHRMLYLHDTAEVVEELYAFLKGKRVDMVSLDATVGPRVLKDGKGHMNFERDIEAFQRMKDEGIADEHTKFVVNHICIHPCHDKETGKMYFHDDMQKMMDEYGVIISYDGMELEI